MKINKRLKEEEWSRKQIRKVVKLHNRGESLVVGKDVQVGLILGTVGKIVGQMLKSEKIWCVFDIILIIINLCEKKERDRGKYALVVYQTTYV